MDNTNTEERRASFLMNEYRIVRNEVRSFSIVEIILVSISILIFTTLFIVGTISNQYILIFISPMVSILILMIGLALFVYTTNLSLLASEIEDNLNELIGDQVMKWESSVGIFGRSSKDILAKRLGKTWLMTLFFGFVIVSALMISTLWYAFTPFYHEFGNTAWIFLLFDIIIIGAAVVIGYSLLIGTWKKIKKPKMSD